ncbi:deoxyribodipyrimidine photo-lyase [Marmoricola endophyticus]|uniref:Deoxyribodipyrimidine photo-lyase n=1 Tax=Marmoricola endophyticus TaxID=2040280 RepID=A0A917F4U1_9ACTN|nr:deoxyribodipyrimidine photo-lyase [Marmoricola endophyticus]GGF46716.1 deoxyribodipyrimidine photo-lyase [Marmoricola endophyticus]
MSALLWLRRDLRRADLPALGAAAEAGDGRVQAVFVIDPTLWGRAGKVRTAWLAASLRAAVASYDGNLSVRVGDPREVIPRLAAEHDSVHVSTEPFPYGRARDEAVRDALPDGVEWVETGSPYAITPGRVRKGDDTPYQVFTPFSRAWREHGWPRPAQAPAKLTLAAADDDGRAAQMIDKALREGPDDLPDAGEDAALARWREFLDDAIDDYEDARDRPAVDATSRLSPYLKVGAIHPRTVLADLADKRSAGASAWETEICWRDFYADVLWHHPDSAWSDLKPIGLDYDDPADGIEAWKSGHTGFPVVDAGMRQLLATGWMHNRVRMITASFLAKDLHAWWPVGAQHFLEHLLDGDVASNNHGWQWAAGTGTDAAPYFRVFNPVTQGKKFDPDGEYVRRWVPELAHLAGKAAHEPWEHDDGYAHDYPRRIVDHKEEREKALDRYQKAKG